MHGFVVALLLLLGRRRLWRWLYGELQPPPKLTHLPNLIAFLGLSIVARRQAKRRRGPNNGAYCKSHFPFRTLDRARRQLSTPAGEYFFDPLKNPRWDGTFR